MRSFVMMLLVFAALAGCKDDTVKHSGEIPACIQAIIDDEELSMDLKRVVVQLKGDEFHYWLNTDLMAIDLIEFVVNETCDTMCVLCAECTPPPCQLEYGNEWQTIWTK